MMVFYILATCLYDHILILKGEIRFDHSWVLPKQQLELVTSQLMNLFSCFHIPEFSAAIPRSCDNLLSGGEPISCNYCT